MSTVGRSDNQAFVNQSAEFGPASDFDKRAAAAQNFRPVQRVLEDQSGHSESSEGIVDHNAFSNAADQNVFKKQQDKPQAKNEPQPQQSKIVTQNLQPPSQKATKKRTIIYSDKSESSIDDMMGDTPSNYNIPNGRMDGKSLGLKAILMHAQKHTGIDNDKQTK